MRVSWCLETSSIKTPFPGWISVPSSFVSLFIFYILSYLLSKTMGCFSGHLMTSASDQKLFCEVYSAFNCSFDEFVGEKVVSLSYSSTILVPPAWGGFLSADPLPGRRAGGQCGCLKQSSLQMSLIWSPPNLGRIGGLPWWSSG